MKCPNGCVIDHVLVEYVQTCKAPVNELGQVDLDREENHGKLEFDGYRCPECSEHLTNVKD